MYSILDGNVKNNEHDNILVLCINELFRCIIVMRLDYLIFLDYFLKELYRKNTYIVEEARVLLESTWLKI